MVGNLSEFLTDIGDENILVDAAVDVILRSSSILQMFF